jgi:hypothetical protein
MNRLLRTGDVVDFNIKLKIVDAFADPRSEQIFYICESLSALNKDKLEYFIVNAYNEDILISPAVLETAKDRILSLLEGNNNV